MSFIKELTWNNIVYESFASAIISTRVFRILKRQIGNY